MIKFIKFLFIALLTLQLTACVDQEFDLPPGKEIQNEDISNTTIAAIKAMHSVGADAVAISEGVVIKGIVTSDDAEGNFFKELVIQDATGGLHIRVDRSPLGTDFERGREVFVRLGGLYLGDYNGLIQVGIQGVDEEVNRIPDALADQYFVLGAIKGDVTPREVSVDDLDGSLLSQLVKISNVEFANSELGGTFANPSTTFSQNRTIEDCAGNEIVLRTSDFTTFAGAPLPTGNGSITAVFTVFGSTKQLTIRNLDDINMSGARCDGSGGGGGITGDKIDIATIKSSFVNGTTTGPEGYIEGVVISDYQQANIQPRNMVIQDASGGIIVRFASNHAFPVGQHLKVSTKGVAISEFNGGLQIETVATAVEDLGAGTLPTARVTTISNLIANFDAWESTLVKIEMAQITGGSSFSNANEISDATGAVATFVYNTSAFANDPLPTGTVTITGIASEFNGFQITLRSKEDVVGGTTGGGGGDGDQISLADIRTQFSSGTTSAPAGYIEGVVISDYTTESVTGRNLHIQDDEGGIVIRFTDNHSYPLGAKLKVKVGGTELSEFNGLLQLNNVALSQVLSETTGTLPTPKLVTIAEIKSDLEVLESTLVMIQDVQFSGMSTFNGTLTATDDSGSIGMFTRSAASFSGNAVPTGSVNVTAIVTEFNEAQILLRSLDDIN